ncbi:hypothetical protein CEP88_10120 [Roseobacter denitrificans]|nr:hypothetical protein CEP88_10120 [Roseobacter denitrificans]
MTHAGSGADQCTVVLWLRRPCVFLKKLPENITELKTIIQSRPRPRTEKTGAQAVTHQNAYSAADHGLTNVVNWP